ncbi:MAG TPA: MMPL family transporter, partial [Spirochaetia bacterium]|nr:MMPL family transporter [Spirochaetia bacterium]
MNRYVDFLQRHGRLLLLGTALIMIASLVGIARLRIETEFDIFMPPDSVYAKPIDRMTESFGDAEQLVILADIGADEQRLNRLAIAAERVEALDDVVSARLPLPKAMLELSPEERDAAIAEFQELVGGQTIVEHKGTKYGLVRVLLEKDARTWTAIVNIESIFAEQEIPIAISGESYLKSKIFDYVVQILVTIPPVVIVLMLLVFRIRIGSFRATVLSMIPAIVSGVITLGLIAWVTGGITIVSVLVPIFVIVLGSADGLHITSHVMDNLSAGRTNREAIVGTLRAVGMPVVLTTLTTMAGFLSQLLINSRSIKELGVSTAIGILIAGLATWIILPAVLIL